MSYEMKNLRKEDISLYYYIKHIVLFDFVEQEELISLSLIEEMSTDTSKVYTALTDMIPSPTERGRGWLYFDENLYDNCNNDGNDNIPEQSNRVVVYDSTGTGIIDSSQYMIDYIDGRVVTSGTCSPVYVSYYWNYISLVDEWAAIEAADPPVVAIDIHETTKTGYQLGAGRKVIRKVDLHIFATSTAERNDIVETLYDSLYLKSCPLYDFPNGTALDYDGTFFGRKDDLTIPFISTTVSGISRLQFENVTSRHVNLPLLMTRNIDEVVLSDLNAYRSKISFELVSYTNV